MASSGPNSTTGTLLYLVPPTNGERAYQHINSDPTTGERKRNFTRQEKTAVIENVRGKEANYSLDTTGYQFYKHKSKFTNFTNDAAIRAEYYAESIELLKKLTGASRVELFDHSASPLERVIRGQWNADILINSTSDPPQHPRRDRRHAG